MISFGPTEEQSIACAMAAEVASDILAPNARAADEATCFAPDALAAAWRLGLVQNLAEIDGAMPPQAAVTNALLLEQIAAGDAAIAMALAGALGFVKAIAEQGSQRQRQEVLPLFASDLFCAAAIAVSDAHGAPTRAKRTAGGFTLQGRKTLLPLAADCSHFLVVADCEGVREAFIVPRNTPRLSVHDAPGTLGLRALRMADVTFSDVAVPMEARLGENAGCDVQRVVDSARVALSAVLTGLSRTVFDYALPYTKQRVVHGEPIARKQSVAFKLADMHIDVEAMRWMALKAADDLDKHEQSQRNARLAQRYCAQSAMWIADEGLQIFGGHGFAREYPLEMWYRNARSLSVMDGLVGA